ncbi:hypothetical protein ACFSCZ_00485 [Siminovitchia sediminis]|uniref:Uncharacterized protein n=1 Tax=Siminovitchia sediminis TaxID=1274353 RepID=A0ABW4KB82_9BACI
MLNRYSARIEPTIYKEVPEFIADFVMVDKQNQEEYRLGILNGDYEDRDDLYICPQDINVGVDLSDLDENLTVVYMYDVLSVDKYRKLQECFYDRLGEKDSVIFLDPEKDLNIDLEEYIRDERIGKEQRETRKNREKIMER